MKKNAPDNHRYLDGDSGPLPLWVKNLSFVEKIPKVANALQQQIMHSSCHRCHRRTPGALILNHL